MCKTTTARLKRSGMRWDADNAQALMAVAGLEQSDQWKLYWPTRLKPTGYLHQHYRPHSVSWRWTKGG